MIHTVELYAPITGTEYSLLTGNKTKEAVTNPTTGKTQFHIRGFSDYGINDIIPKVYGTESGAKLFGCSMIVNLERLSHPKTKTVKTFKTERDFKRVKSAFYCLMGIVLPLRRNIDEWSVQRIDYNIDLKMEQKRVEQYIVLLQRGAKNYSWKVHGKNKTTHPRGSVLYDNGRYSVSIYDKHLEQSTTNTNPERIRESEGVLRIEIQVKRPITIKSRFEKQVEGKPLSLFARYKKAEPLIKRTIWNICGEADYCTFAKAVETIEESKQRQQTKKDMIEFLRSVNANRSVWKARAKYKGKTRMERILERLKWLNINPTTIPREFGVERLENLYHQIGVQFAEEKTT